MMIHDFVDGHLDRHWLVDLDGHVFLHGHHVRLLDVVRDLLYDPIRHGFLHWDGDGFVNRHRDELRYLHVNRERPRLRNRLKIWHGNLNLLRNFHDFVLVHRHLHLFDDLDRVGQLRAVAFFESGQRGGEEQRCECKKQHFAR